MSATVIDSLLVLLGLDTTPYKKGAGEAKKITKETEGVVKKSAESMVKSLRSVGLEFVGLFLAVKSVSDVVHYLTGLSSATRQLGIDAKNFGTSAAELKDWQNAAVLAGGSAEDVTKTIGGLQQSLFNLKFNGQVNEQIITLQRLGVNFRTATNKVKPFNDVMLETSKALERSGLSYEDKFNFLQQAGFDKGSTQLILQGTEALKKAIAEQRKAPQVTDAQVQAAARMDRAWDKLKQNIEAGARELLVHAEPAVTKLFAAFERGVDWVNAHQSGISDFIDKIVSWATGPGADGVMTFFQGLVEVVKDLAASLKFVKSLFTGEWGADKLEALFPLTEEAKKAATDKREEDQKAGYTPTSQKGWWSNVVDATKDAFNYANGRASQDANRAKYAPVIAATEERYGIPKGVLMRMAQKESQFRSDIISGVTKSPKGAVGIMQLMPGVFKGAGQDPNRDIDTAGKELSSRYKQFKDWELAVASYNDGSGNVSNAAAGRPTKNTGKPTVPKETIDYVNAVLGANATPGARRIDSSTGRIASNTSVQIDSITVNTQATNAGRMAADMEGAVQRKLFSAHADGGVT